MNICTKIEVKANPLRKHALTEIREDERHQGAVPFVSSAIRPSSILA
jgi:hypothetical protein